MQATVWRSKAACHIRGVIMRLRASDAEKVHLGLMLVLTFSTGIIDAVGYLGLDRVFTGNMTGNVVILGMGIVGADDLPVLGPLVALAGFMAGAAVAGRVHKRSAGGWTHRATAMIGVVAAMLLGVSAALFLVGEDPARTLQVTITALLGGAMGVQAAVARFIAVKDITTVVVTSTITGLAADSVLGSGKGGGSGRRAAAILLILAGASAGALLLRWHLGAGVLVAGVLTAGVATLGAMVARR